MKKAIVLLVVIILLFSLTGCWSRREVGDLAIAVALGIDKDDDGNFIVTTQILNPSEVASSAGGGSGYDTPTTSYTASGKMLFEALRRLTKQVPRKIYLAHLRMIVIGEDLAREGIYDSLDFLSRDHEMRTDFYIVVAKEIKAKEILSILTSIEKLPANKMFNVIETSSDNWAATGKVRLNDLIDDIVIEGKEPVLPGITISGDPNAGVSPDNVQTSKPKAVLKQEGLAVFKHNRLVGWLNEDESKGYNYIQGNVESTVVVTDCKNGQAGIELLHTNAKIKPRMERGKPVISITIEGEANVADVNCQLDVLNPNTIRELEKKVNDLIEKVAIETVDKAQKEYKTDFLGFGERIFKELPSEWRKLKDNWTNEFENIKVDIKANTKIRGTGTISSPFHNEIGQE